MIGRKIKVLLLVFPLLAIGCVLLDDNAPKKPATTGLIATPPSYYSTAKARYLGGKYKENLDRMVERIVRNPKTSTLQFANNISSVGGIGFFTHSAAKTADERYLEVVLATPETFETKGELSDKVQRLFSQYAVEILGILSGDSDIYQDKELSGYGLNLAWRNILAEPAGNRVTIARAIIYFPKDRVRNFIRHELNQNDLLGNAVIFAVEEDGPLTLVSYQPRETRPDLRPAIREDNLTSAPAPSAQKATPAPSSPTAKESSQRREPTAEPGKREASGINQPTNSTIAELKQPEAKVEPTKPVAPAKTSIPPAGKSDVKAVDAQEKLAPVAAARAEPALVSKRTETIVPGAPVNESKPEPIVVAPIPPVPSSPRVEEVISPPAEATPAPLAEKKAPAVSPTPAARVDSDAPSKKSEEMREEIIASPNQMPVVAAKKNERDVQRVIEAPKPASAATAGKTAAEVKKPESASNEKQPKAAVAKIPAETSLVAQQKEVKKSSEPPTIVAKAESVAPLTAPRREIAPPTLTEKFPEAKTREPTKTEAPAVKSTEPLRPVEAKSATPAAPIAKSEAQPPEVKSSTPATKGLKETIPGVKPREPEPAQTAKVLVDNKTSAAQNPEKITPAAPVPVKTPTAEKMKPTPATGAAKVETRVIEAKSAPAVVLAPPQRDTTAEKSGTEQIASLRKPAEIIPDKRPLARPAPKALEGFIIQLGFNDKEKARHWAETMEQRGYAVSVTEAGAEGALRVRLGNFAVRDDAERQLRTFKQEGLSGIIINLPQGFRPEARSSIP
ncbi:MAG TPA: SPOR domain-containing protein [Candidatus Binatia bacterium]|nr:SPOR domain-containing protein [Candidatus Binatia bacterium]